MVRHFSVAVTALLTLSVLLLFGFKADLADEGAPSCALDQNSLPWCSWSGDSEVTGEWWTQPGYYAETKFNTGNNIDDDLRASVSSTVKREGVTVATPSVVESCMGCEGSPALHPAVSGSVDGCDGESSITVTINSTHKVEITSGLGDEETFYSSDSKLFSCP